ncbi:MAG: MFS transporter [Ktedonobacterales bacterium]
MASARDAASGTEGARQQPASLWRNTSFLLLWGGQAVSAIGTQVSQLAYPLLVLALTHSPAQAGFIGAVRLIPYMLLSLPAGALVDRWNRKRVMILCDLGRALALGSVPVAVVVGRLSLAQLYVVSLIEGTLYVFFSLAETAALTRVVSKEQLPAATARNETMLSTASTLGPMLSGAIYIAGRMLPFLADAISYGVSVVSLCFIRTEFQAERATARTGRLVAEIRAGVRWLWRQRLLRFLAVFTGGVLLVENGYILVVIVLLQSGRGSPLPAAVTTGLVLGAGGAGSIIGSLLAEPLSARLSLRQITLGVNWSLALLLPLYLLTANPLALGLITAAAYGITPIFFVATYSYRLSLIPDELQGRVNSVFRLVLYAGQPIGLALTGVLLQALAPARTVLVLTAVMLALALTATVNADLRMARPRV